MDTKEILDCHSTYHHFYRWLSRKYGKDLYGEKSYILYKDENGREKKLYYRPFNDYELSKRLVGYEVMCAINRYIKRNKSAIKIVRCDDSVYSGSYLLLIPHPRMGITIMFIPQCTSEQNSFFLYKNHCADLIKGLKEMKYVYKNEL